MKPLVTIVTPTIGTPYLRQAIESVKTQTYGNIQYMVVVDGIFPNADVILSDYGNIDVVRLPFSTGADRFNGHRIYGAASYLARGEFICYLDEDNWLDPNHVESLVEVVARGNAWAFSLRKIFDKMGNYVCNDDCESLGKWPSFLSQDDYLVDVGCYFLPRNLAVQTSPVWYRKTREPGVPEVDRMLLGVLKKSGLAFDTSGEYTLNYRSGNTVFSVKKDFFLQGNVKSQEIYKSDFPWRNKNY